MAVPSNQVVQGTIHVDQWLTNFSLRWSQDANNFIGQRAATLIPVQKQSDKYLTYDRGWFWRDEAQPRPLGGRPVQVGYKIGEGNYNAVEWALEHVIDDRLRANADTALTLDENATILLTKKMMLRQERIWAQNFWKTGVWSNDVTGVVSSPDPASQIIQWGDATSTPIEDIDRWKDAMFTGTGFMPNTLVLGANVKRKLRTHPDIADRIKYTQIGIADEALIAQVFDIPNVLVARSLYNSALEGATDNFQYIVDPNAAWMGYIEQNPSLDSPTAIANFAWTGLIPGSTNTQGGVVERGRDERAHSDWFQDRMAFDLRLVAPDLGVYLSDLIH